MSKATALPNGQQPQPEQLDMNFDFDELYCQKSNEKSMTTIQYKSVKIYNIMNI